MPNPFQKNLFEKGGKMEFQSIWKNFPVYFRHLGTKKGKVFSSKAISGGHIFI